MIKLILLQNINIYGHIINCDLTDDNDVQAHVGTFYARANIGTKLLNYTFLAHFKPRISSS